MEDLDRGGKISIFGSNLVFMISILLLVTIGGWVQDLDFNYGILITEFILVVVPVVIYILIKKDSLKRVLRLNKLNITEALLVIVIFVSGYFVAVFLGVIGNIFVSFFGDLIPSPIPMASNSGEYFVLLLIVAGSAGFCEEILFRGLILRAYEGLGKWKSIIFTAVLFGIMHVNVQNFLGPVFLGIVLGFVVYHTDSIFAGMLGHFTNNAVAVSLSYALLKLPFYSNMDPEAMNAGTNTASLIAAAAMFGFIAVITGGIMVMCMLALKERSKSKEELLPTFTVRSVLRSFKLSWPVYVGVIVFLAMVSLQLIFISM